MRTTGIALAAGCFLLAGCQTGPGGSEQQVDPNADTYIGWYCKGDKKAETWTCTQRRLRDGEPVDNIVLGVKTSPDKGGTAAATTPETAAPNLAKRPAGDNRREWLDSLPALNDKAASDPVSGPESGAVKAPGAAAAGSERSVPVTAFEEWATEEQPAAADSNRAPGFTARVEPGSAETIADGFTIQLGAFSSKEKRESFVEQKGLGSLKLRRFKIASKGQTWWILTYGDFRTRDEAIIRWAAESKAFQPLEVWVRSTDSIKAALPTEGVIEP